MKRVIALLLLASAAVFLAASTIKLDPVPIPVSGNAVTLLRTRGQTLIFSFMGIGAKKSWDAVTNTAYSMDAENGKWLQIRPVPGTVGRLGAIAVTAREQAFLLGGYVVDARGGMMSLRDVNVYAPLVDHWYRAADLPIPVERAVGGVYRDRYIYVVGGRSNPDPVKNVQVYDIEKDTWFQATPLQGVGVFGHAGALVGDTIIYIDGAYRDEAGGWPTSSECWMGKIDRRDPAKIEWTKLAGHPGDARFGIAAGGSEKEHKVYFFGGSAGPYNYAGMGPDGKPAAPLTTIFAFNLRGNKWELISDKVQDPTMGHRGLIVASYGLILVGGMEKTQQVTANVAILPKQARAQ